MRGKECCIMTVRFWGRITPAYAGKSSRQFLFTSDFIGSPPPMRGKARFLAEDQTEIGITPAYAGKRE